MTYSSLLTGALCAYALATLGSVLKLAGAITWSWWAVLSPLWVPVSCYVAAGVVLLLVLTVGIFALSILFGRWS